jgi:hypothetical protein
VTGSASNSAHASGGTPKEWEAWVTPAWLLLTLLSSTGCFNHHSASPTVPAAAAPAPPLHFTGHDLGDDSVVRVVTPHTACTGTVIEERLVLTAHHCIAERNQFGEYLERDIPARDIEVQLGGDYLPWGEVRVTATVAPPCGYNAGLGDIAILVLDQSLSDVGTKEVALDERPAKGSTVEPIGFGRCADSEQGIRLRTREGGKVELVTRTRFQAKAAICPGDSGGPGLSDDGTVIGVVSASELDTRQDTLSRTEFTRVDQWQDVFANAHRLAEGDNPAELPPIGGCDQ